MGVVFFPNLPFMGVMLFPSFRLGNALGEGGASLALLFLFFYFSSSSFLPLVSSFLFFLSSSLFSLSSFLFSLFFLLLLFHLLLPHLILPFPFLSPFKLLPPFFFFLFCLSPLSPFLLLLFSILPFFFEGTACIDCFQDVGDDVTGCNPIVIRSDCNKERLFLSCL